MAHIASKVLRRSICTHSQRVVHWHLPTSARLFNFNFTATVRPGSAVQHSGDRRSPASPAQPTLAPAVRGVEQLVYRTACQHTLPYRVGHQHGQKARELCWSVGEKSAHERAEEARKAARVLTVPNVICVVRIAATPGIAWLLVSGYHDIAFYGFVAAGISDGLDGFIARRFDQRSVLGSYLDPLADKLLINSMAVACMIDGLVHPGLVALMALRDVLLVAGAAHLAFHARVARVVRPGLGLLDGSPLQIRASPLSKCNTALQLSLITTAIAGAAFPAAGALATQVLPPLTALTATTTVLSFVDYVRNPGVV